MNDFKAVRSSLDISKSIAFYLEMSAPEAFRQGNHARLVKAVNDILQGRSDKSVEELLTELEQKDNGCCAKEIVALRQDIQDFLHQKELLIWSCGKSRDSEYVPRPCLGRPPLKIIDQKQFDQAAKTGFPPGFFQNSYFDQVTIYCVPDETSCSNSVFQNCSFAVCRIQDVSFTCATICDCEFHSSDLYGTGFLLASLAHTQFHDCTLRDVNFNRARMKSCNVIDCSLDHINFNCVTMDSCSFGRVKAKDIYHLVYATITQGGATQEECQRNRTSIFQALGVEERDL